MQRGCKKSRKLCLQCQKCEHRKVAGASIKLGLGGQMVLVVVVAMSFPNCVMEYNEERTTYDVSFFLRTFSLNQLYRQKYLLGPKTVSQSCVSMMYSVLLCGSEKNFTCGFSCFLARE